MEAVGDLALALLATVEAAEDLALAAPGLHIPDMKLAVVSRLKVFVTNAKRSLDLFVTKA